MDQWVTYYVAAPIAQSDDGTVLYADEGAIECPSAEAAIRLAEEMASSPSYVAAVAFSRSGCPFSGQFGPAEVLKRCGSFY
jgi:hypothetical protein